MYKAEYTLGRGDSCDVVVGMKNLAEKYLLTISKTHLKYAHTDRLCTILVLSELICWYLFYLFTY